MALPLLLAGPILRRVDPTTVAVWLAVSESATARLSIWEGRLTGPIPPADLTGAPPPFASSGDFAATVRIADALHLVLLVARIEPTSAKRFQADTLYSYDVEFRVGTRPENLRSLGQLTGAVPLGYEPDLLPSFAPPPSSLDDLRLVYGSCRRPGFADPDAMVWIDDYLIEQGRVNKPTERPHQLYLGGDQIYADDVDVLFMRQVMATAARLLGTGTPTGIVEQIPVGGVLRRNATAADPAKPELAYSPSPDPAAGSLLPVDDAHFPAGKRLDLTQRAAQLTSVDGRSHLLSFAEFAATYLLVWSEACWDTTVPDVTVQPAGFAPSVPLSWTAELGPKALVELPPLAFPPEIPQDLFVPRAEQPSPEESDPAEVQRGLRKSHRTHRAFLAGLPKVRRAMANIPTYMILDDHDVTDDYFLNPLWRRRVLGSAFGRAIVRNGMLAYGLFQDWGNDPRRYDTGVNAEFLITATGYLPKGVPTGPADAAVSRLDTLFGHETFNGANTVDGTFSAVKPPMLWHFGYEGPTFRVAVLDNRTRRSYRSDIGPPGNVSIEAQEDQIPKLPLLPGQQLLIVIAPLQVIGPPVLDSIVAPSIYRFFDLSGLSTKSKIGAASKTGHRKMPTTNPDAIEAWAFDSDTFEHLLTKLVPYGRVVLLSGDVHNSSGSLLSYWAGAATKPTRIAQFTSSGFKNVMPGEITAVDRSAGFAQQMIRAGLGTERLGWSRPADDLVLLPEGRGLGDLTPGNRSRLRATPVLLPTWGWPDDRTPAMTEERKRVMVSRLNPSAPPDWRWRVTPLVDQRPDFDPAKPPPESRPSSVSPEPIDTAQVDAELADPATVLTAYQRIATRHQHALNHLRNARQILFRGNYGLLRFRTKADPDPNAAPGSVLVTAIHEVYTAFADPDQPAVVPLPEPYLLQTALLDAHEDRPEVLRAKVIEPTPVPEPVTPGGG